MKGQILRCYSFGIQMLLLNVVSSVSGKNKFMLF